MSPSSVTFMLDLLAIKEKDNLLLFFSFYFSFRLCWKSLQYEIYQPGIKAASLSFLGLDGLC